MVFVYKFSAINIGFRAKTVTPGGIRINWIEVLLIAGFEGCDGGG